MTAKKKVTVALDDDTREEIELAREIFNALNSEEAKDELYSLLRTERCLRWLGIESEEELIEQVYSEERKKWCQNNRVPYIKNEETDAICPNRYKHRVRRDGYVSGTKIPRYECLDCKEEKGFSGLKNTLLYNRGFDIVKWYSFIDSIFSGLSIEETARRCGIGETTAQLWRLLLFHATSELQKDIVLFGDIEVDETFLPTSYKGKDMIATEGVFREQHKRGKSIVQKDIQKDYVCIICGVDSQANCFARIAGLGAPTEARIEATIGNLIDYDRTNCFATDGERALAKFAEVHNLHHEALIGYDVKGRHIPRIKRTENATYSIQHINAFHSSLKRFLRNYQGVSTKYLQGYLSLFTYKYSRGQSAFSEESFMEILKMLVRPGHYIDNKSLKKQYSTIVSTSIGNKKLAKFTPSDIEMYTRYAKYNEDKKALCDEFGCTEKEFAKRINAISKNEKTADLAARWYEREKSEIEAEKKRQAKRLATERRRKNILLDYDTGISVESIAIKYGVSRQAIYLMLKNAKAAGWVTKRPVLVKGKKPKQKQRKKKQSLYKSTIYYTRYKELQRENPLISIRSAAKIIAVERGDVQWQSVAVRLSNERKARGEKAIRRVLGKEKIEAIVAAYEGCLAESSSEKPVTKVEIYNRLARRFGINAQSIFRRIQWYYKSTGKKEPPYCSVSRKEIARIARDTRLRKMEERNKRIAARYQELLAKGKYRASEKNPIAGQLMEEFNLSGSAIYKAIKETRAELIRRERTEPVE